MNVRIDYIPGEPEKIKFVLYNRKTGEFILTNYGLLDEDPYVIDWYKKKGFNILGAA